jgi:hypothetical protein
MKKTPSLIDQIADPVHRGLITWYGLSLDAHRNPQDPYGALRLHPPLPQW